MEIRDVEIEIFRLIVMKNVSSFGAIAQLVEHLHGMQGASGSSPLGSIQILARYKNWFGQYPK